MSGGIAQLVAVGAQDADTSKRYARVDLRILSALDG
jgi:hypothetical protein